MSLVLAVLSSVLLGGADFAGGLAAKRMRAIAVVIWSNAVGLGVALLAIAFVVGGRPQPADIGWGLLAGLCGSVGAVLLYRALASGVMMLAAPIAAVSAALLPVAVGLWAGERLSPLALSGVGLAALALILISRRPAERPRGLAPMIVTAGLAFGAGLGFGAFMVSLANTPPTSGLWPLALARITSLGVLLVVARAGRVSLRGSVPALRLAWLAGVLDMASSVLYLLAVREGSLVVVGLLASMAPVSTVILARVLLKERTYLWQQLGAGLALSSVVLLALT